MTILESQKDISAIKDGGKILASVLKSVADSVKPGITTIELDVLAEKLIRQTGAEPSFKNYKTASDKLPFPASLCASINDEVVHGVPKDRILKEGDIIGLDLGVKYKGFYTDSAITVPVGPVNSAAEKLIKIAQECLYKGISVLKEGAKIGDIGFAVQSQAEKNGFGVVKKLVGHGLGRRIHESPQIPNFGSTRKGLAMKTGVILAIEPMITAGGYDIYLDDDMWTWKTTDGSLAAHFEHTIMVTKDGAEIITKI